MMPLAYGDTGDSTCVPEYHCLLYPEAEEDRLIHGTRGTVTTRS